MSEKPDEIDKRIRAFYAAQKLDAGKLARLQAAMAGNAVPARFRWTRLAMAAVVLLAFGFSWRLVLSRMNERTSREVVAQIAAQHVEPFHAEFDVEDFGGVKAKMVQLDFTPIEPRRCQQSDYRVAGASYAMLNGRKVAKYRLAYPDGPPVTLYEMKPDQFPSVHEGSVTVNGTPITLWDEGGLLMALAGTPAE